MSTFIQSIKSDLIKSKRSSAFWLSLIGAFFIPAIFFLMYTLKPEPFLKGLTEGGSPWFTHYNRGWQSLSAFLLPMFVILTCSLIVQIEFKNNAWKQVFASPQSLASIYFSKLVSIHGMILFTIVLFNLFMLLTAVFTNLVNNKFPFFSHSFPILGILKLSFKTYISILAIISIQYWLSMRIKNFIAPIAIGLGLLITSIIIIQWEHVDKVPYAFPMITFLKGSPTGSLILKHEWYSIVIFIVLTAAGLWDLKNRKERG